MDRAARADGTGRETARVEARACTVRLQSRCGEAAAQRFDAHACSSTALQPLHELDGGAAPLRVAARGATACRGLCGNRGKA
eukprot:2403846-Pleurochrysis_carterae.AAC.2